MNSPLRTDFRRVKIVATLGPMTSSVEMVRKLALAGADVFRLNFSHGSHEDHLARIQAIRQVCMEFRRPFGILGDLSGPKLRLGQVKGDRVEVRTGDHIELTAEPADGTNNVFQVTIPGFAEVVRPGEQVLIDDGAVMLLVESSDGERVRCRVQNDGVLLPRKGVNLPQTKLAISALSEKDRSDLAFALSNDVDFIALSFVRSPEDLHMARNFMETYGRRIPLLAKIEKMEAVDHLEDVIDVADGAMVARGDLGIEVPMERVPAIQKRIIQWCNLQGKPVITATQMLDSMIRNPRPTRAEVTDIYNAILDGTDAVMLSGETASGLYPVEAVEMMDRVAAEAEKKLSVNKGLEWILEPGMDPSISQVISHAAVSVAERLKLDCIICPTWTGTTARRVAQYRPTVPVYACSPLFDAVNSLCLSWGVNARQMPDVRPEEMRMSEADALVEAAISSAREHGFARPGSRVVVIGGVPLGIADHTNFLRVIVVE